MMDLVLLMAATMSSLMVLTSSASIAALSASPPQQVFTCLRKLLVELASPLSKYRRHLYLQDMEEQENTWQRLPP
jgi:hypothetical protein